MSRAIRAGAVFAVFAASVALAGSSATAQPTAKQSIIGGHRAPLEKWGFTTAILQDRRFICSGSVISPTRVLTAAHCTRAGAGRLRVVTGRSRVKGAGGQVLAVTSVARPANYVGGPYDDVAVLSLSAPTTAPPIPLVDPAEDAAITAPGAQMFMAGYGDRNPTIFGKRGSGLLMTANSFSRPTCERKYRRAFDDRFMVCALGPPIRRFRILRRSVCFGDSGGPLIAVGPSGPALVGVANYIGAAGGILGLFVPCALHDVPNVFARVAAYKSFIAANL